MADIFIEMPHTVNTALEASNTYTLGGWVYDRSPNSFKSLGSYHIKTLTIFFCINLHKKFSQSLRVSRSPEDPFSWKLLKIGSVNLRE